MNREWHSPLQPENYVGSFLPAPAVHWALSPGVGASAHRGAFDRGVPRTPFLVLAMDQCREKQPPDPHHDNRRRSRGGHMWLDVVAKRRLRRATVILAQMDRIVLRCSLSSHAPHEPRQAGILFRRLPSPLAGRAPGRKPPRRLINARPWLPYRICPHCPAIALGPRSTSHASSSGSRTPGICSAFRQHDPTRFHRSMRRLSRS